MSRCAGAGREQSQAANPSWPMEILCFQNYSEFSELYTEHRHHAQYINGCWLGGRNFWVPRSLLGDRLHNQLLCGEKTVLCIICFAYFYCCCCCYYYSFLFCLIKLSLSEPTSFSPFSSPSHWRGVERVSGCVVRVATCRLNHDSILCLNYAKNACFFKTKIICWSSKFWCCIEFRLLLSFCSRGLFPYFASDVY